MPMKKMTLKRQNMQENLKTNQENKLKEKPTGIMELKIKVNDQKAKKGQEGKDGEEEEVHYRVNFKQQD